MKKFRIIQIIVFASLITGVTAGSKDIVHNGDFRSKKLEYWQLSGSKNKYGKKITPKISKHSITCSELILASPRYLILSQYVNIEKGKKYKLTFEAKIGEGTEGEAFAFLRRPTYAKVKGNRNVKRKDRGYETHHIKPTQYKPTTEWKPFTIEFTGLYKTDNGDLVKRGPKQKEALKKDKEKWKNMGTDPGIAPTLLVFQLGGLKGEISIRKVSIVEVK